MKKLRIFLIGILLVEIGYFFYTETVSVKVETPVIESKELFEILNGLKVAQISDLHIKRVGVREKQLIEMINKINPNILFVTGDFVSDSEDINSCIEVLKSIVDGRVVIAVLGNNDHSFNKQCIDTKLLIRELEKIGVKVLQNESLKIARKSNGKKAAQDLYVIGLDDNYLWFDDIFKAQHNVPESGVKILLAHSPHIIEKINTKGINLILSGHTHGGQIKLPFIEVLYTNPVCNAKKKFISGLYREDTTLYVNRGIGISSLPFRIFCKPEITLFEFKP